MALLGASGRCWLLPAPAAAATKVRTLGSGDADPVGTGPLLLLLRDRRPETGAGDDRRANLLGEGAGAPGARRNGRHGAGPGQARQGGTGAARRPHGPGRGPGASSAPVRSATCAPWPSSCKRRGGRQRSRQSGAPAAAPSRPRSPAPNRRSWPGPRPRSTSAPSRSAGSRATPGSATPPAASPPATGSSPPTAPRGLDSTASACPRPAEQQRRRSFPTGSISPRSRAGMTRSAAAPASTARAASPSSGPRTRSTSPPPTRRSRSPAPPRGRSSASAAAAARPYPNQRASLLSLDTAGRPTVSNGGKTFTYSLMRGTLTADGVNVFAGFYTPPDNDEFGCVSVEFTTP